MNTHRPHPAVVPGLCKPAARRERAALESGTFAAFLEVLLPYRWIFRRDLGFAALCGASILLFVPLGWLYLFDATIRLLLLALIVLPVGVRSFWFVLDVITLSSNCDRLTLTATGDPLRVAMYEPMRRMYAGRPEADGLLDDRFGLARGGSADALARDHIRLVVGRTPVFVAAADDSPVVDRIKQFNDWTLYGVTRTGQANTPQTALTKRANSKS